MNNKNIILTLWAALIVFTAVADNNITSAPGSVTANSLSVTWLDNAWNNREIPANQKLYINSVQKFNNANNSLPQDYETSWKAARLIYFLGNYGVGQQQFAANDAGISFFDYGVRLGKQAIKLNPDGVEGHYWYAVNLGSYGLVKGIMASAMNAKSGMKSLEFVRTHDDSYHWSGANRILGKYYYKLPAVFGGDNSKALASLSRAVQKVNYSNNWVFLGQYYLAQNDRQHALQYCRKALSAPKLDGQYEEKRYAEEAQQCIRQAQSLNQ